MDAREKRKRVMSRSIKLGHCVCDPRKPCPCPLFDEKNICTCAGESVPPENEGGPVKLTEHVRAAGCASKIGQKDLHKVLAQLPAIEDPRLLVGTATADDAGVFKLTDDVTVIQTVDVFTPGVDDPFLFGRIAACNSISDVYAMGGVPVTALSIVGFPIHSLPHEAMAEMLRGGISVLDEAGTILLGGHSINDDEVKCGFAVTGVVRGHLVTNAGARPGDMLILTKPLGTGIISLAHQIGRASEESVAAMTESMATLNRKASEVMVAQAATAGTDVTGFGLLGHLCQMVIESGVRAEIWCDCIPLLPGVMDYATAGMFSGANERNADYSAERSEIADDVDEAMRAVLYDAQTSGGLLFTVPESAAAATIDALHAAGLEQVACVGRIVDESSGQIRILNSRPDASADPKVSGTDKTNKRKDEPMTEENTPGEETCCAHEGDSEAGSAVQAFANFMGHALQPGELDVVSKELIAVSLSLAVHCVPCTRIHIKKALKMGISASELEEAAALAIGFSGARTMMLWKEVERDLVKSAK